MVWVVVVVVVVVCIGGWGGRGGRPGILDLGLIFDPRVPRVSRLHAAAAVYHACLVLLIHAWYSPHAANPTKNVLRRDHFLPPAICHVIRPLTHRILIITHDSPLHPLLQALSDGSTTTSCCSVCARVCEERMSGWRVAGVCVCLCHE